MRRSFAPGALYVTKRKRSELLAVTPEQLEYLAMLLPGRRVVGRFGSWWGRGDKRKARQ